MSQTELILFTLLPKAYSSNQCPLLWVHSAITHPGTQARDGRQSSHPIINTAFIQKSWKKLLPFFFGNPSCVFILSFWSRCILRLLHLPGRTANVPDALSAASILGPSLPRCVCPKTSIHTRKQGSCRNPVCPTEEKAE